jgi:nucleotide-binding universal stress UspA family protein
MDKIVVGIDGSEQSKGALRFALEEGELRRIPVVAVHAWTAPIPPADPMVVGPAIDYPTEVGRLQEAAEQLAERVVAEVVRSTQVSVRVEHQVVEGPAAGALLDRAGDDDMIVVGSRGHGGLAKLLLGSVSDEVARHAECPVVIHRTPQRDED